MGKHLGESRQRVGRFVAGSILLGVGLGGFVDGIVFHQILQWHHMLSATDRYGSRNLTDLEHNILADGLFHAATWLFVVAGLLRIWATRTAEDAQRTWRALIGGLLVGFGLFNGVEGVINHHLLQVHHLRDDVDDPLWWDLGFLASAPLFAGLGWVVARRAREQPFDRPAVDDDRIGPGVGEIGADR